jgi:hypothetical protein
VSNKKQNFYLTEQKAFMRESYFGSGRKINGEWFITLLNVTYYHAEHAFVELCKVLLITMGRMISLSLKLKNVVKLICLCLT